jgi:hypothetical protein
VSRLSEEEQRLVQQAFQRNFFSMARQLPMKIRINGRGEGQLATPNSQPFLT